MALRRWRGPLVTVGVQTGDGRIINPDAISYAPLPLPFAFLRDGDQHINLTEVAPQVGIIESIELVGADHVGEGVIDDANPDGAELVRRMEAGTASHGHRQLVSIDPDDWAVQIVLVDTDETDEGDTLLASAQGTGRPPARARELAGVGARTAAAGEPDPGDDGTVVLWEEASDSIIERYTRMRIRGATACAVSAFTEAWIELVADAAPADDEPAEPEPEAEPEATTAAASPGLRPSAVEVVAPPREAFYLPEPEPGAEDDGSVYGMPVQELLVEQPDGGLAVPFTVVERDGVRWCFGHAARWGQCHIGYPGECVTAPDSPSGYAHFHHGSVLCADGNLVATGPLSVGTDHAAAHLLAPEAIDWYANTGLGFADVRASDGGLGVWTSGVIRPSITDAQLHVIRASSLSGDWRRIGVDLEFIGALAVSVPGFGIARELVAAAALQQLPMAALAASAGWDDGRQVSLTAAGVVQRCPECQRRAMSARAELAQAADAVPTGQWAEAMAILRQLDYRTRPMVAAAAEHALATVRHGYRAPAPPQVVRPPLARR